MYGGNFFFTFYASPPRNDSKEFVFNFEDFFFPATFTWHPALKFSRFDRHFFANFYFSLKLIGINKGQEN